MSPHRHHPGVILLLLITVGLSSAATTLLIRHAPSTAHAADQSPSDGLAQVIPVPLEFGAGSIGLALIDRNYHTICIYQYHPRRDPHKRLSLVAARSFRYDIRLEQFNTDQPLPHEVKELLLRSEQLDVPTSPKQPPEQVSPLQSPNSVPAPEHSK